MITKLYWTFRILAYLVCLGGVFYYLACLQRPGGIPQRGLLLVYSGFLLFFLSTNADLAQPGEVGVLLSGDQDGQHD